MADIFKEVFRPAADVAAVVLVRDEVAGTWRWERKGKHQRVAFSLFAPVEPDLQRRVEEETERLAVEI
ncbi:MAG: DNA glycosylase AlkZ-like family protein [Syntrophothermus sp.]